MKRYAKSPKPDNYIDFLAWKKGEIFRELFELGYDPRDFIEQFQTSSIGEKWDNGKLSNYIGQSAYAVALTFAADLHDCGIILKQFEPDEKIPALYTTVGKLDTDAIAWIGQIYEMWAKYAGLTGKKVYETLDFCDLYAAWQDIGGNEPFSMAQLIAADPQRFKLKRLI